MEKHSASAFVCTMQCSDKRHGEYGVQWPKLETPDHRNIGYNKCCLIRGYRIGFVRAPLDSLRGGAGARVPSCRTENRRNKSDIGRPAANFVLWKVKSKTALPRPGWSYCIAIPVQIA
jgi:hypothetical protein